jgi:hypothetical protein
MIFNVAVRVELFGPSGGSFSRLLLSTPKKNVIRTASRGGRSDLAWQIGIENCLKYNFEADMKLYLRSTVEEKSAEHADHPNIILFS